MAMVSSYRLDAARLSADRRISAAKGDWAAAHRYGRLINEYLRLAQEEERKYREKEDAAQRQKTPGSIREDAAQWQKAIDSIMNDWKF